MAIRLQHPQHGFHNFPTAEEVEAAKKLGWVECIPKPKPVETESQVHTAEREQLVAAYVDKFGKKPHHKLSDDKLREALKG